MASPTLEALTQKAAAKAAPQRKRSLAAIATTVSVDSTTKIAGSLHTTKKGLAVAIGLSEPSVTKLARIKSPKTQMRLREFAEILDLLTPLAGTQELAFAYYKSRSIPELGGRTAEALVKDGKADQVREYLDHVATGGYA